MTTDNVDPSVRSTVLPVENIRGFACEWAVVGGGDDHVAAHDSVRTLLKVFPFSLCDLHSDGSLSLISGAATDFHLRPYSL